MIATLRGEVLEIEGRQIIIDVQGVGYQVTCTMVLISELEIGKQALITTYTEVKEDAIRLYGFSSKLEKQTFLLLTMVKGIGPKSAMDVISRIEARELLKLIAHGNLATLKAVKGIGQKTAERIIVELKDKVAGFVLEQLGDAPLTAASSGGRTASQEGPNPFDDAHLALLALGFSRRDVEGVITSLQNGGVQYRDSGDIVRESLKQL
jgi:Holliday junction DNA helicase RuvA